MSDNPHAVHALSSAQEFRLPGHDVLAITGRDATAFAQAQFMNDVAALPDGHWHWNGWLTPKGRVVALFALLKFDAETLWLLLPDVAAAELAAKLQRYVFRSKVALAARDDLQARGGFAAPAHADQAAFARIDGGIELDMGGDGGPRTLRLGAAVGVDDADAVARWAMADLAHGLPRLSASQAEQWTPQQLSLERLRAFSVKKGCYPGQEIVARTHFLGQAKRGLALFHAAGPVAEGAAVETDGRGIGTVACVQDAVVLAVVPLDAPRDGLHAGGAALTPAMLQDGLAR